MGEKPLTDRVTDPDTYCRAIETYLCRRNDGHLIRIVGPAFDLVRGWAARGIPLTVVFRGIDHRVERAGSTERRNRRRRPIRIEFCEDEVLDVFDEWRRAVGVRAEPPSPATNVEGAEVGDERRHGSLPAHLQRAIARLTAVRGVVGISSTDQAFLGDLVRELDAMLASARSLRGQRRDNALARLVDLDSALGDWAARRCPPETMPAVRREAERELETFRERMPEEAYARSLEACCARLLRERAGVPRLTLD
ncbi:MAG: hypothetical protein HYS05_04145 [Acidobacteria bacterium]|nr:hypothetical protein [Acidobacteriota bacterium]